MCLSIDWCQENHLEVHLSLWELRHWGWMVPVGGWPHLNVQPSIPHQVASQHKVAHCIIMGTHQTIPYSVVTQHEIYHNRDKQIYLSQVEKQHQVAFLVIIRHTNLTSYYVQPTKVCHKGPHLTVCLSNMTYGITGTSHLCWTKIR